MKINPSERSMQITDVEKRLEQLVDYFHSVGLKREDHFVALYLLFIYYKNEKLNVNVYKNDLYIS